MNRHSHNTPLRPSPMFLSALLLVLLPVLGGCGYLSGDDGIIRDRASDYRVAEVLPPIRVPEDLDTGTLEELYVIPETVAEPDESQLFSDIPLPKPLDTRRREGVIIQNLGERQWVVIDANPGQVWPLVRDYWSDLQVALDYENPSAGLMDTSWLEVDNDEGTRHRYRVHIEPGLHSGYSEIYIKHLQQPRDAPLPIVVTWPEVSSSKEREDQIINTLSQYLADRNDVYQASSASLLAGSIQSERKANIVESPSGHWLELRIDFDRAWVQVRQALEAAQVEILETDREGSRYRVSFAGIVEDDDGPGFFGRLIGRSADDEDYREFEVQVLSEDEVVNVVAEPLVIDDISIPLSEELLQAINNNLN